MSIKWKRKSKYDYLRLFGLLRVLKRWLGEQYESNKLITDSLK